MEDARAYLDWAATAPLCSEAADAMRPFLESDVANLPLGANANSLHSEGRAVFAAMEDARANIARIVGARPDEVVFTGGATESDYMALVGLARAARDARMRAGQGAFEPHVVVSAVEHSAIVQAVESLEREGMQVDRVGVDSNGRVDPAAVSALMRPETVLVSIMAANNEVGTVEPIAQIAQVAHQGGAIMHTDAAQALGKISFDCHRLGVDAASFSAHKVCGPKGVGALYLKAGTPFSAPASGGGQESGRRGGTQNVCGIVGFAAAVQALAGDGPALEGEWERLAVLRDRLYQGMCACENVVPSVTCAVGSREFLPNVANVCVKGMESETLILRLDVAGFAVAGGSACSSRSLEPSRVLLAMGIDRDTALGSLRVSIGRYTTQDEVERFIQAFLEVVKA